MKLLDKLVNDTLKEPDGRYSRKSLTTFASFTLAALVGIFIVVSNYFFKEEINRYAIDVFYGFLLLSGGATAATVYEKLKNKSIEENCKNNEGNLDNPQ